MFRQYVQLHSETVDSALLLLSGVILMGLLSPHSYELADGVQFVPQVSLMLLWPVLWGWKIGTLTILMYLIVGGVGIPVFLGQSSGWTSFAGPSGGYLFAYPLVGLIAGWMAEGVQRLRYATASLILLLCRFLIELLGLFWFTNMTHQNFEMSTAISDASAPILVQSAMDSLVVVLMGRILTGHRR